MRFAGVGILLATATLTATGASAVTLENIAGVVRVNQGDGFKPVSGTVRIRPGDRVLADGTGEGAIRFGDGCTVPIGPGSVFLVPEVSPCALNAQFPAAEVATGSFAGGFGGLAGIAGIAGVAGAAAVATVVTTGKNNASQQTNQQRQLIEAAILARPGPTSP